LKPTAPAGNLRPIGIRPRPRRRAEQRVLTRPEHALARARAFCERYRDPALSALLVVELVQIFLVEPIASLGFKQPLAVTTPLGLFLILVLASHRLGALVAAVAAVGIRAAAGIVELAHASFATEAAAGISAVLALLAVSWVISGVVFGPGRITSHRVRGAIVLYLTIAIIFAWLYRLIAEFIPGAFAGLSFHPGDVLAINPSTYYSLTTLTSLGFGDIAPVNALARSLTTLEAVIGQLYPPIILARILMLYSEGRGTDR
jgi:hypothetical protein